MCSSDLEAVLHRDAFFVVTIGGHKKSIPVKYGLMEGRVYTAKPEFDAANAWAKELGLPVREVLRAIHEAIGKTGTEQP